ncbi:hypothetical protein [Serratia quinivorans]
MSYPTRLVTVTLLFGSMLLSGCQTQKKSITKPILATVVKDEKTQGDAGDLKQCQQSLSVLDKLQAPSYSTMKKEFDGLMLGASQYAGVRFQVNGQAQDTIDALYRYRVSYLCAEIQQAALEALVTRGGMSK